MGDLGVSVGAPWDRHRTQALATETQRIAHDDARRRRSDIDELVLHANVTCSKDSSVRSTQEIVDDDALVGDIGNACGFEIQARERRSAPDAGEDCVDRDRRYVAVVDRFDELFAAFDTNIHRPGV